ncbi:aspartate carbamoyltransferase [Desulfosarcina sp.]|uniref:aspartate carbamoyltransferase n=1 Tax=Desulfosarcina sp. TaxID=2027861 RepID=UPI0029ACDB1E|nr:aspartate carbamoyltransferase [Desulfosarcina sp.]MDX2454210.1 aspartate carbamoyltransferase [Desulfosarcina sp.]MDX2491882.1 aspartate carbamoyltransferase [Desulfosarcina sp.]
MAAFPLAHVIESQQFDRELLEVVFQTADQMKADLLGERRFARSLDGRIMASLFYEPSTRTRFSFESAMLRLGGAVITTENAREFSSAAKGESLSDSTRIMNGYADVIVMRHNEAGSAARASEISCIPVINAGDGAGQHPTQALLDMYTIMDAFPEKNSLKIAMVGDLRYGRTVRSLSYLLTKYENVEIIFVSPPVCKMEGDIKAYLDKNNVPWREETDLAEVAPEVDCVYMTRIQKERFHDPEDYKTAAGRYILTPERVRTMKPDAIIMHPLPRVDEIPKEVDDDPRAQYFQQAMNGLYIRMALLYLLLKKD